MERSTRQAIKKVRDKKWSLLVSKDTVAELIRVLAYRKFGLSPEEIQPIIEDLIRISEFVEMAPEVTAIRTD